MYAGTQPDREASLPRGSVALALEHFRPRGEKQLALVMIHGFSAYCSLYRHVAVYMASRGIAVTGFDARGHGRSGGRRGHVDAFSDYLDDLAAVVDWARAHDPGLPWALIGHSFGGTVALSYALDESRADKPSALVLAAPWLKLRMAVSAPTRFAANVAARVLPTLSMPNGLRAEAISRNPQVQAVFQHDPLIHHTASAGWFMATLRAQARLRVQAGALRVPGLMLLAGEDRIVANEANLAFAKSAGAPIQVRTYEGLYHELYVEPEAERVLADIADWLLRRPPK